MRLYLSFVAAAAIAAAPAGLLAQHGDLTHQQAATQNASVDFGVFPGGPLGPPPCFQSGAIGGPLDPCAFKQHHLTPEEVTIEKEGQVTFQIHGGGHAFAIYEVSKATTRDDIGQFLCPGTDASTITDPAAHTCLATSAAGLANAAAAHTLLDGHNDVVIVAKSQTAGHPDNRWWCEPGRLMSAVGRQFLNGGTIPAGPNSDGQLITYRF